MKNLMVYVDPSAEFNEEHKTLAKIQIDNSLELGWNPDDILVVTNFPWDYRGVYSFMVSGDCYYPHFNRATKIPVINRLFEIGLIDDYFWFHDFDAFQLEPMEEVKSDFAITTIVRRGKFRGNAGSFFFRDAKEIFERIETAMWHGIIDEEDAIGLLMTRGELRPEPLDPRYNIHIYDIEQNVHKATKPLMVAHFHPRKTHHMKLFKDIVPDKLKAIFNKHGVQTNV